MRTYWTVNTSKNKNKNKLPRTKPYCKYKNNRGLKSYHSGLMHKIYKAGSSCSDSLSHKQIAYSLITLTRQIWRFCRMAGLKMGVEMTSPPYTIKILTSHPRKIWTSGGPQSQANRRRSQPTIILAQGKSQDPKQLYPMAISKSRCCNGSHQQRS